MRRTARYITAARALLIIFIVASIAGGVWVRNQMKRGSTSDRGDETSTLTIRTHTPTLVPRRRMEATEDFGDPATWLFFNRDYREPGRGSRFRYPPGFELTEDDSSLNVWIDRNDKNYLVIGEQEWSIPIWITPQEDYRTPNDQLQAYFSYYRSHGAEDFLPDLATLERIDLGENIFVYKSPENGSTTYIGMVGWGGIEVTDFEIFSEEVVYNIIRSIEFKEFK